MIQLAGIVLGSLIGATGGFSLTATVVYAIEQNDIAAGVFACYFGLPIGAILGLVLGGCFLTNPAIISGGFLGLLIGFGLACLSVMLADRTEGMAFYLLPLFSTPVGAIVGMVLGWHFAK